MAGSCGSAHLDLLACGLSDPLRISDFGHDVGHFHTELTAQLLVRRLCVLNSVVKQRCRENDRVVNVAFLAQNSRECDWVVYVRRGVGVLAALVPVFVRGKMYSAKHKVESACILSHKPDPT